MLLSASEPLTTLIKLPAVIVKLPAVIVLAAPHKPVAAQTDPAVKPVSHVPQNGTAAQAKPVQSAGHGVAGSAGATPTVVNIVPAPTPNISLKYSSNGIISSSSTPGVSVGPLVTRGSAPLRPPVGTIPGEPTPSIDRNERAFDLAALGSGAGLDAELLLGLTTNRSDGNGEDTPVDQATRTSGLLIALRGPGDLPVMVSSVRGQSLIDPAAVLATLAAPENLPDPGHQLARLPALPPLEASGAFRRGDEVPCTDFLKAACGLMLGIGLTTGPLYPDLMALCRNFLP